ncbi:MAG: hypothetical protein ACJA02_000056 [Myxococcota bacterium]|jgi:hypothetical protein
MTTSQKPTGDPKDASAQSLSAMAAVRNAAAITTLVAPMGLFALILSASYKMTVGLAEVGANTLIDPNREFTRSLKDNPLGQAFDAAGEKILWLAADTTIKTLQHSAHACGKEINEDYILNNWQEAMVSPENKEALKTAGVSTPEFQDDGAVRFSPLPAEIAYNQSSDGR